MGLSLKGIGNFFGNLFGGDDDEEKKRKQQNQPTQNFRQPNPIRQQPTQPVQQQPSQQPDNGLNLVLPGQTRSTPGGFPPLLEKAQPADGRTNGQKKIDELTQSNLKKAIDEENSRSSWLDRNITDRGGAQKRAEITARRRAVTQYQDQNGYSKQPEVEQALEKNRTEGNALVDSAAAKTRTLEKVGKVADKVGQVAQYVPVTGSIINLGLSGAEQANVGGLKDDIANQRAKNEFGMTKAEFDALPPDQKAKLQNIRNISYGLAPLDVLGFGGLAKAEGVQAAKKATIQLVKEGAVDQATKTAVKQAVKQTAKDLAVPTAVGTGVSLGGQQYLTGDMDPIEALKSGLLVGGTSLLFPGKNLGKSGGAEPEVVKPTAPPEEAASGVESVNPNREADAATAAAEQAAKQEQQAAMAAENAPAANKPQPGEVIQPEQAVNPEMVPEPSATPAYQRNFGTPAPTQARDYALRQKYGQLIRDNPQAAPQLRERLAQLLATPMPKQVQGAIPDAAMLEKAAPSANELPVPASSPAPAANDISAAPGEVPDIPVMPAAADTSVVPAVNEAPTEVSPAPAPALTPATEPPTPDSLPTVPDRPAPQTADVAPRTHDALVKQLGAAGQELKGKYGKRAVLNIDELKQDAEGVVANMSDQELVQSFSTADPATMVTSPESFAIARASLSKLSQSDDPAAAQTVKNLLDGMAQFESRSGQGLRVVQEEFDAMPIPMKVRYIVKKIDSANAENPDYVPLGDDPARAAAVEANITAYLQKSQTINESISVIQGQLNGIADAATRGEKAGSDTRKLVSTLKDQQRNLESNNGELVKYYQDLMPKASKGQKVNDFARRMMLASFTGRVNDVITTAANITNLGITNVVQGALSKAVNFFKPGKVTDTTKGTRAFISGTAEGLRKAGGEFRGEQYVGDVARNLNNNTDMRSGLQKARGPVGRTIQAATEFATKASEGVRDQRLYQLADQEAAQLGLEGDMRRQYAEARTAVPSRQMQEAADQLHLEINNLNDNPVTRTLNQVSNAIGGNSAIGGFVKNQIMPFTSWLGGNIYNSITDRNVIASSYKLVRDLSRGDAEGAVRNLSKTIVGAAQAYAIGYVLTQQGYITNTDAEGYNDAGAYFHIGDRYIPVGFLGFFAPNIVLGNAAYNGMNSEGGDGFVDKIATFAGDSLSNFAKSLNAASALGVDNNITRAWEAGTRQGGNMMDGLSTLAGSAVSQFIPGITGDINAVLNNGFSVGGQQIIPDSLNPTHERADTKATKTNPETGRENKDYVQSAVNGVINRIPFASQQLPRKADVAADDLVDRVDRGNRDTAGGKLAKAEVKSKEDRKTDFEKRDIPNPDEKNFDDAVKARTEEGNYDAAIEGIQAKISNESSNKDFPKSKMQDLKEQVTKLQVLKAGNYDPSIIELYKSTDLSDWRNMGDPESEDYDPETYQKLYDYDSALAQEGVSKNDVKGSKNAFYAKEKKGGKGGDSDATKTAKSNTVSSPSFMGKINFDIPLQKAGSYKAPTIQQLRSSDLVKKRKISVGKA